MKRHAGWLLFATLAATTASGQSIVAVAGGGVDDGRPATQTGISAPRAAVADPRGKGDLLIVESGGQKIRRVSAANGRVSTALGTGVGGATVDGSPATLYGLGQPIGIEVDGTGTFYVADANYGVVVRVDGADGTARRVFGVQSGTIGVDGEGILAVNARAANVTDVRLDGRGGLLVLVTAENRIRRVDLASGRVNTIAGPLASPYVPGAFSGDGGPATLAKFFFPLGIAVDPAGNVLVVDTQNHRLRRIATGTGIITTIAGNGTAASTGDGGPATQATLSFPGAVESDAAGNLFVSDTAGHRVRRIDAATGVITAYAGTEALGFSGDGGPAAQASFRGPRGLRLDGRGGLLVCDGGNNRTRRIDLATGVITTVAGNGDPGYLGDGGPPLAATLSFPTRIVLEPEGSLLLADSGHGYVRRISADRRTIVSLAGGGFDLTSSPVGARDLSIYPVGVAREGRSVFILDARSPGVRRLDVDTGVVTTVAGGGSATPSDGIPGTAAKFLGLSPGIVAPSGFVYFADQTRVWRLSLTDGTIRAVAGNGASPSGVTPADGLGTQIPMRVSDIVPGGAGTILLLDGTRIRRLDPTTGFVTTIAGNGLGAGTPPGDGTIATQTALPTLFALTLDPQGRLVFSSTAGVYRLEPSGSLSRVAPIASFTSSFGDGGPVSQAGVRSFGGIAVDATGTILFSEILGNRVRAVAPCGRTVSAPILLGPADGASSVSTAPALFWSSSTNAFRYNVYLDIVNPPAELLGTDLTGTALTPSNLAPGVRHYWRVVAIGDPYCPFPQQASSSVGLFVTAARCGPPAATVLSGPADSASGLGPAVTLAWNAASGAASYDVYMGASSPPPLVASGVTGTSFAATGLPSGTYSWFVVARAVCDGAATRASPTRRFTVAGACSAPAPFARTGPTDGASGLPANARLSWSPSAGALSYDLFLGTTNPPPLALSGLMSTSVSPPGLVAGSTWFWKVVARAACDASRTTETSAGSFSVAAGCASPGAPTLSFAPPGAVAAGRSYTVGWTAAVGLDAGGVYLVERARDAAFATMVDRQIVSQTSATFLASDAGTYHHRVRAVPSCGLASAGPFSGARAVSVATAEPTVVFTIPPAPVVTELGTTLEDQTTDFTLENLGADAVDVVLSRQELSSTPFFTILDPSGGDATIVTLEPRAPRTFRIRFEGPSADVAGAYQGLVVVTGAGRTLPVTPYAFVNLKVGGGAATTPEILVGGRKTEYVAFPGFSGDDRKRLPLEVQVRNPGSSPMELAAQVGPELWLVPEAGWNATPIPPGGTRTLRLFTRRSRAPNGSALPRYTYLTLRTKGSEAARLLVQDNDAASVATGRSFDPATRSVIVPSVVNATSAIGNAFVSRLRLTNSATEVIQAELIFTPANADGFDASVVRRATVVIPPNDVATVTDPLVQLYGLTPPVAGSLEVRLPADREGAVSVSSVVDAAARDGGTFGFQLPVVAGGDGARLGTPHVIPGLTATAAYRTNLILVETTGASAVDLRVTLFDTSGNPTGDRLVTVPRFGQTQLSGIVAALGGGTLSGGRLELVVESGAGAVAGVVTVIDNKNDDAVTYLSRKAVIAAAGAREKLLGRPRGAKADGAVRLVVPAIVNGFSTFPGTGLPYTFQSLLGFTSLNAQPATFTLTFLDLSSGASFEKSVAVPARRTVEYENAVEGLFGLAAGARAQGPVLVDASPNGVLYAKVFSKLADGTLGDSFPVVAVPSSSLTGGGYATPLAIDGLEQSVDRSRGTRANLILNETLGKTATVKVQLFEAGNRSRPIAEAELSLQAYEKLQLSTVFSGLGLDSDERRKDRTNVLCVVTASGGDGLVSAVATLIDNKTGDTKNLLLAPSGTSGSQGGSTIGF